MGNYTQTRLAMASELNLDYMDSYFPGKELMSRTQTANELFSDNAVRRLLENSGYQTYTYENLHWPFITWDKADHLLKSTQKKFWIKNVTEFEKLFLGSTLFSIPFQYYPDWAEMKINPFINNFAVNSKDSEFPYLYNQTNFMIESLPKLTSESSPKFVYAHFGVTHAPFYFNADGSLLDQRFRAENLDHSTFVEGYTNQLDFINPRLLKVLTKILDNSSTPPIIILQSDHGYDQTPENAGFRPNQNLIAIYLPGVHQAPYKSISSVNIFRYVLNEYFGMNFPYLEDISYEVNEKNYSLTRIYDLEEECK